MSSAKTSRPGLLRRACRWLLRPLRSERDRDLDVLETCPEYWDEYIVGRDAIYTEVLR